MSQDGWSGIGTRKLDFGGGRGKEILMGAALALVVVAALVLAMWHIFVGEKPEAATYHMKCLKCGYEFDTSDANLPDYVWKAKEEHPTASLRMHCPQCKTEWSCVPMTKCPNCQKYFVADEGAAKIICPYCQTDVADFAAKKAQQQRR